ncbi:hypothetical protein BaRGS_00003247 [Batillaria attramentaria]|uniref:Uncharacterized protein n=1 Tax=Batillaria attramentaria TaxID=370345 RepID=A0ABD0M1A8_9CAEN
MAGISDNEMRTELQEIQMQANLVTDENSSGILRNTDPYGSDVLVHLSAMNLHLSCAISVTWNPSCT